MYNYIGKNNGSKKQLQKEFEDENDAIEFSHDNFVKFPEFTITDLETDEIVWSDIMEVEQLEATEEEEEIMSTDEVISEGYDDIDEL